MDYLPVPNKKVISSINKLNHYMQIFSYNKRRDNTILLLKKKEFDIFYSCKRKYPLLVAETINALTGMTDPNEPPIDRRYIDDPFREDTLIPSKSSHTLEDYLAYMEYGGSMGHNAPAGQHKTNINIYNETFLLSNITPQEMVFNSGLWVIMENWCKYLYKVPNISKIMVFTGSIPEEKLHNFNGIKMNIPLKMFKIVCFELVNHPGITFMDILIANNSAYYVNPNTVKFDLSSYLVPTKSQEWFQNFSGINLETLLEYYGYKINKIKPFRSLISMEFYLSKIMRKLMKKSNWFGYIIYSHSLSHLENKWNECQKFEKEFETLKYHQQFYELTKKRLIRDKDSILELTSFKESNKLFRKLSNWAHTKTLITNKSLNHKPNKIKSTYKNNGKTKKNL
jgi:DNA/RNA endonuclease G (NUC1)